MTNKIKEAIADLPADTRAKLERVLRGNQLSRQPDEVDVRADGQYTELEWALGDSGASVHLEIDLAAQRMLISFWPFDPAEDPDDVTEPLEIEICLKDQLSKSSMRSRT